MLKMTVRRRSSLLSVELVGIEQTWNTEVGDPSCSSRYDRDRGARGTSTPSKDGRLRMSMDRARDAIEMRGGLSFESEPDDDAVSLDDGEDLSRRGEGLGRERTGGRAIPKRSLAIVSNEHAESSVASLAFASRSR